MNQKIKPLIISIQGDAGSNHHLLVDKLFDDLRSEKPYQLNSEKTFKSLVDSVLTDNSELGVMAIENSIAGSILQNYDLLSENSIRVVSEGYLRIEHCLIGTSESQLKGLKAVYSHEMALKQSMKFIEKNNLEAREYYDTAAAVPYILEKNDASLAAIAPALAADVYGGKVLVKGIETSDSNYTRFIVISKTSQALKYKKLFEDRLSLGSTAEPMNKVMIEFTLRHEPGSLLSVLSYLAESNFNLTKIESRPIIGESWNYRFYVDFLTKRINEEVEEELKGLMGKVSFLRILGIFTAGETYYP